MKIQHYRQSRNVPKLSVVPGKLRKQMLRNCIRFEVVSSREDNIYRMELKIEEAMDQHTTKLFHMKTSISPVQHGSEMVDLMYVSLYFERYEDMERFQKHFMVMAKLSH